MSLYEKKDLPVFETRSRWRNLLSTHYGMGESDILFFQSLESIIGIPKYKVLVEANLSLPSDQFEKMERVLERLVLGEPIQYIFKEAYFRNRPYLVNPNVLIPRPETEELVSWILEDIAHEKAIESKNSSMVEPRILDIGTGTGCIPISLYLEKGSNLIYGLDISLEALKVAWENTKKMNANISLMLGDILQPENPFQTFSGEEGNPFFVEGFSQTIPEVFDILVSNPPYIPLKEKNTMEYRVKNQEPSLALFVPDQNPLQFYEAILKFAEKHLSRQGQIYFEINESYSLEIKELANKFGHFDVELRLDFNGKPRMVRLKRGVFSGEK